jgi:hypothetical protein
MDRIDHMELHTSLLVFASSTTVTERWWILSIDISDGSLLLIRKLDYTNLEADTVIQNMYKSFFLAESASNIYLTIKTSDNSEMGFMRLLDFATSDNIEWYAKIPCGGSENTLTYCEPSALAQDASNDDYIYFASLIQ